MSRISFCSCLRSLLAGALLAWMPAIARADGLIRDGIGAISSGRGGTNLGFADNGVVLLDNPGAMVNVRGNGLFDAGVDTVISQIHYTDPKPNNVYNKLRPFPVPELSYIRKSKNGRWAWGIGMFAPAGYAASYDMQNSFAGPQVYKSTGALGKLLPGISYRVTDRLSIGGTFGLALGHVDLEGPFYMQSGPLKGAPAILDLQGTGVAPTGSFGLQYIVGPKLTLGLAFTSQTQLHMGGSMQANIYGVGPVPIYSRFASKTDLIWPRSLAFGAKYTVNKRNRVAADVYWYDWTHAFNQVNLNLTNPSNPMVTALVGPAIVQHIPLNWRDSVSMRLGYEWLPTGRDIFRFGYVYHASPSPNSTLNPFLDGVLLNTFSVGYSRRLRGGALLNAAYQFTFSGVRHVGQSALAGGDFTNSTLQAQAHWASLGILVPF